ncbi:MAG: hypothetical protein KAT71_08140 [Gammaproteobacteria bacterium]|nr:hypothetical protein [Gammaproteobacteria bacterium]
MSKITQHQAILYQLMMAGAEYLAPQDLMGEVKVVPFDTWVFVSYEANSRVSEIKRDNPELIHSDWVTGKSGARYQVHRLKYYQLAHSKEMAQYIKSDKLRAFYLTLCDDVETLNF